MYLWVKALHIIAVIAWMAGMLYLPRLFVYHAAAGVGSEQSETFKTMEHRLLNFTPANVRGPRAPPPNLIGSINPKRPPLPSASTASAENRPCLSF